MVKTSNRKYDELNVGTTVRLSIPDVDRARGSPRNVLAVVTEVKDDLYKLCKKYTSIFINVLIIFIFKLVR
jgi:hypothetical protein